MAEDTAAIKPDKVGAGYNYDTATDLAEIDVREIVEDARRNPTTPQAREIGAVYGAWMDEAGIDKRGLEPLKPYYLTRIAAIGSRADLVRLMAEPGYASPIGIGVEPDEKDPTRYTTVERRAGAWNSACPAATTTC